MAGGFFIPPAVRAAPAVCLILALGLLSVQSYTVSDLVTLQVMLVLHPLYYFTVFRPGIFPAWLAFLLGFAIDIVVGKLLGLNAFLLVLVQVSIGRQRRYLLSQPFATQWAGFMVLCLAVEAIRWAVMGLVTWTLFSPASAGASAICNAALYPLTSLVMLAAYKLMSPRQSRDLLQD